MNATGDSVVGGVTVTLSCSLVYRKSSRRSQLNASVVIVHPGAEVIDTYTEKGFGEITAVMTVKVKSCNGTGCPSVFGPVQCKVVFSQPTGDTELNADKVPAMHIQCKCFKNVTITHITNT